MVFSGQNFANGNGIFQKFQSAKQMSSAIYFRLALERWHNQLTGLIKLAMFYYSRRKIRWLQLSKTYLNVDIIDGSINRFDKNWQCVVFPENLSWQFQINVGSVGDNFSITRGEFQASQKSKIDAFPNPSSGSDFGI